MLIAAAPGTLRAGEAGGAKAPEGPTTLFDLSHSEIFSPVGNGPLEYSAFTRIVAGSGNRVMPNRAPVTPGVLRGVSTYIIAGPTREFNTHEIAALRGFVQGGGNLLVLLHIAPPVARLTEAFDIIVSNFVVAEGAQLIGGRVQDFYVTAFEDHPVTHGLGRIALYGSWALLAEKDARTVASTSGKAWADLDRNRVRDEGEAVASFGIVAVAEPGAGRVVVVADDAPFANRFFDDGDNTRLARNITAWFNANVRPRP